MKILPDLLVNIAIIFSFSLFGLEENQNYGKTGKWILTPAESHELNMSANICMDYSYFDSKSTLFCLDHNHLYYYDIKEQRIYKTDTLVLPVGFIPQAIRCVSPGVIAVASDMPYRFIMYDLIAKKKSEYNLDPDKKLARVAPAPDLSRCGVELKNNGLMYLIGVCVGEGKFSAGDRPCGIALNLDNRSYSYFMDFPEIYYQYNWGGLYYRMPFMTGNTNSEIVFSFPASHNIYIYNTITGIIRSMPGGSSLIKEIHPFSDNQVIDVVSHKDELTKYFFGNPSYSFITFDKYRNLYFRLVEFPNPDYGKSEFRNKPVSLLIFDKSFNFLGETRLPQLNYIPQIMVTEKNLILSFFNPVTKKKGYTVFNILSK